MLAHFALPPNEMVGHHYTPALELWTPEGHVIDVCFLYEGPGMAEAWLEHADDRSIVIKSTVEQLRWAFRIRTPDGIHIIAGDERLWFSWAMRSLT